MGLAIKVLIAECRLREKEIGREKGQAPEFFGKNLFFFEKGQIKSE